jgi:polyphosphate kinase
MGEEAKENRPSGTLEGSGGVGASEENPMPARGEEDPREGVSRPEAGGETKAPPAARAARPAPAGRKGARKEVFAEEPRFFNREISWLHFNRRVLEEALDESNPLLERVKFLAIFANNLDEFFMIRVSGLRRQLLNGVLDLPPDGLTPAEQLAAIRKELSPDLDRVQEAWKKMLLPKLRESGVCVLGYGELSDRQRAVLRRYFEREIFPVLTPLAFDPGHPFPHISNLSLNLAVVLRDPEGLERFARLKIPKNFPRFLPLPSDEEEADVHLGLHLRDVRRFVPFEEIVRANLDMLFPGIEVEAAYPFRVTRDADLEIEEDEAEDLISSIQEGLDRRRFGSVVRLEIERSAPKRIRDILMRNLEVDLYQVYALEGPIGKADLMELTALNRPDLKDYSFVPAVPVAVEERSLFEAIRRRDLFLMHPYDSFAPVIDFVRAAARDPDVLAIKQTLYRVGRNSPIVEALLEAREHDKQVAVLVELKARFDEENNIGWARALESEGVHVVYGVVGLKTHAKICLVVRRERGGIRRYVHMGTGNYNAVTANVYGDLSLFTADPEIGSDASDLFNALTGYAHSPSYRRLIVAPRDMRRALLERIDREIRLHRERGDGRIVFKMNALVDRECIEALYRASRAGVRVDLQIRGICCLRPEVPGLSENVRVSQIVGRFLEHARIYAFRNGGEEEVLVGSADLMPRNLDRRVELLFPVLDPGIREMILRTLLPVWLQDTAKASLLQPDGSYRRIRSDAKEGALRDAQAWFLEHRGAWGLPG